MKYAIISDIHGNLQALEAVLKDIKREGADRIFCLGDIVGYGANPRECIEIIEQEEIPCVMGNHDLAVSAENQFIEFFNPVAREAVEWTGERLDARHIDFLRKLPYTASIDSMIMSHANIVKPEEFGYLFFDKDPLFGDFYEREFIKQNLDELNNNEIAFIGHTHIPQKIISENGNPRIFGEGSGVVYFGNNQKAIFNAGSVGQPRDRDNRACYLIFDSDKRKVEFRRVDYDTEEARRRIIEEGIPKFLGDRLLRGW